MRPPNATKHNELIITITPVKTVCKQGRLRVRRAINKTNGIRRTMKELLFFMLNKSC